MPVRYDAAVRTSRMTATRDYYADGTLVVQAADNTVLATFGLSASGGTISGDTWTLAFDATTVAATATGTATKAEIRRSAANGGANPLHGLTVGTDVTIDNASIASGQNVQITGATITHAPNP